MRLRFAEFISRNVLKLGLVMLLSILPAAFLARTISVNNAIEVWLPQSSPEYQAYKAYLKRHGGDEFILIAVSAHNGALLSAENRERLNDLARSLRSIPGLQRVTALSQLSSEELSLFRNLLISDDKKTGALWLHCKPLDGKAARRTLVGQVRACLKKHEQAFQFRIGGPPVMNEKLDTMSDRESKRFFPISFAVSFVILLLITRCWRTALVPLPAAGFSVVWTLALMVAAGRSMNMATLVIPSLLWVLSLSGTLHFIHVYRGQAGDRVDSTEAVRRTLGELLIPCICASMTTSLGFATLSVSTMGPIRDMGVFAAIGIILGLVANLTITPAALVVLVRRRPEPEQVQTRFDAVHRWVTTRPLRAVLVGFVVMAASIALIFHLKVESNVLSFFKDNAEIVQDYRFITKNLCGLSTIELELAGDPDNTEAAAWELKDELPELPGISTAFPRRSGDFMVVSVFVTVMESRQFNDLVTKVKAKAEEKEKVFDDVKVVVTGTVPLLNQIQEELIDTQVKSFALSLVMIAIVIILVFRSLRATWICIPPNLLPVLMTLGAMALTATALDSATVTIAGIAIGIAVDDTIHFMARVLASREPDEARATLEAYRLAGPPIVHTSVIIMAGFASLAFSEFRPIALFGLLSAFAMLAALIADLFLLPALIMIGKPLKRKSNAGNSPN